MQSASDTGSETIAEGSNNRRVTIVIPEAYLVEDPSMSASVRRTTQQFVNRAVSIVSVAERVGFFQRRWKTIASAMCVLLVLLAVSIPLTLVLGRKTGERHYLHEKQELASCEPCINRTQYTLKAIFHGTSDDYFWQNPSASARQAVLDMRVQLELELYPPRGFSEEQMADDIRAAAEPEAGVDALIVSIPSKVIANAVRFAQSKGMPVFGANSGFEEGSGPEGLIEDGSILFFTAMDERLGGKMAAALFLEGCAKEKGNNTANHTSVTNATQNIVYENFTHALFVSPSLGGEVNSAFQQRFEGYRALLTKASNNINVEWFKVDATSPDNMEQELQDRLSNCTYQSVLVGAGMIAPAVANAIEVNGCDQINTPTKMGSFDTTSEIYDLIAEERIELAIDQYPFAGLGPCALCCLACGGRPCCYPSIR